MDFIETHLIGPSTQERIIDNKHCPPLKSRHITYLGHSQINKPYRIIRINPAFFTLLGSLSGHGKAWVNDQWVEWPPYHCLLAPANTIYSFEPVGDEPWELVWTIYEQPENTASLCQHKAPTLISRDPSQLATGIQWLIGETNGSNEPAVLNSLCTLIDIECRRIGGASSLDPRMWQLWQKVDLNIGHAWCNHELAQQAHVSEEHLRRLCQRAYGHSPMAHLTEMRMQRASTLLRSTPRTIEDIALSIGFGSVYSFSTAFKRWAGLPPSHYRDRESSNRQHPSPKTKASEIKADTGSKELQ